MKKLEKFYKSIAEILDIDIENINDEFILDESNWDSLAIISTAAAIDEIYNIEIKGDDLYNCKKISDIVKILDLE